MLKKIAIAHFKSAYGLAKALRINQSAVSRWGKYVPMLRAAELDKLTEGQLKFSPGFYMLLKGAK